jgi:RNA polymerase sigma factor (sigma-70 family)
LTAWRTVPDADLLDQFLRTRDEAAFAALVRRHRPTVLAACRQVLIDDADVEDAAQQTFLVLWRNARSIRNRQSVAGWLFGVAHRLSVKGLARARRRRVVEGRAGKSRTEVAKVPDMSWREACVILHEELDRLSDKHRLPLLLCYLDGKSRDEAAKQLGWSVGAVKGHLERGRIRLRDRLARRGVTLSAGLLAAAAGTQATAGPVLRTAAILEAVLGATKSRAALASTAFGGARAARRLVMLAAAIGLATVGVGARLGAPAPESPPGVTVPQDRPTADQQPALMETVAVRGRVIDPEGRPVTGARLFTFHSDVSGDKLGERATTDAEGRFHFNAPKDDLYYKGNVATPIPVIAGADGFGTGFQRITTPGDEITIRLVADQPIAGRILDTNGRPVAGATVHVADVFNPRSGRLDSFIDGWTTFWHDAPGDIDNGLSHPPQSLIRVTPTDRDGRFRITGIGAERLVKLVVRGPRIAQSLVTIVNRAGFDPAPVNRAAAAREPPVSRALGQPPELYAPTFDFVALPNQPARGTIREAGTGRPIAGVHVAAGNRYGNDVDTNTDADGRFELDGLAKSGTSSSFYIQRPPPSPYLPRHVSAPNPDGLQPLILNIELARGVLLTGRVGDGASGAGVFANIHYIPLPNNPFAGKPPYDPDRNPLYSGSTGPDGRLQMAVIPGPGLLTVHTYGDDFLDHRQLSPYMPGELSAEDRNKVRIVDRGGGQHFLALADGSLRPVNGNIYKVLDLPEGAGTVPLELSLDRGRTTTLRVLDEDGQPLVGAIVAGLTATWPNTYTLPKAENTVYALNPGKPRKLVVYHPEKNLAGIVTARGDETGPLVAKLAPAATITGRVLDADGQPVKDVIAAVSHGDDSARELDRYLAQRRGPARTRADGRFRVTGVIPGLPISLQLRKGSTGLNFPRPEKPPRLTAGQTLDVGDIRVTPRPP